MGEWRRCAICGEHGAFGMTYNKDHVCAPVWEARIYTEKNEEDWHAVHANDAGQAAAKFCEAYDQDGDYDIVRRGSEEIEVRKSAGDKIIIIDVSAESVPHYYGRARAEDSN
jgi:hypothetical protein